MKIRHFDRYTCSSSTQFRLNLRTFIYASAGFLKGRRKEKKKKKKEKDKETYVWKICSRGSCKHLKAFLARVSKLHDSTWIINLHSKETTNIVKLNICLCPFTKRVANFAHFLNRTGF